MPMIGSLICPLILPNPMAAPDAVALVARIYNKPMDRRISQYHVYLCGLHGERLRILDRAQGDVRSVWWRDRMHLRWTTKRRGATSDDSRKFDLVEFDFKSGNVKRVGLTDEFMGHPELVQFRVPPIKVTSLDRTFPATMRMGPQMDSGVETQSGHQISVTQTGSTMAELVGATFDPQSNRLWLCSYVHFSDLGPIYTVYLFDWRKAALEDKFEARVFDFSPNRDLYGAVDHRELADYTPNESVWVGRARVGNWKAGKEWAVLGGLAETIGISLRPD